MSLTEINKKIVAVFDDPDKQDMAIITATKLGLHIRDKIDTSYDFCLVFSSDKTWIKANTINCGPVYVDFTAGKSAHRRKYGGGTGQAIAKAVGLNKKPQLDILDVTGGYAADAFVLASLGATVTVVERSDILNVLLQDGIERAYGDRITGTIIERMCIVNQDSIKYLLNLKSTLRPDVIYMDPMYPLKKRAASVKAKMQLLHQLIGPDTESGELLKVALKKAKKRVVVKRPKTAPVLSTQNLVGEVNSKNTRYDIYHSILDR